MSKEGDLIFSAIREPEIERENEMRKKSLELAWAEKENQDKLKAIAKDMEKNEQRRAEILKESGAIEIFYEIRDRGIKKFSNEPEKVSLLGLNIKVKDYTPAKIELSKDRITLQFDFSYSHKSDILDKARDCTGHFEIYSRVSVEDNETIIVGGETAYTIDEKTSLIEAIIMALTNPRFIRFANKDKDYEPNCDWDFL